MSPVSLAQSDASRDVTHSVYGTVGVVQFDAERARQPDAECGLGVGVGKLALEDGNDSRVGLTVVASPPGPDRTECDGGHRQAMLVTETRSRARNGVLEDRVRAGSIAGPSQRLTQLDEQVASDLWRHRHRVRELERRPAGDEQIRSKFPDGT